MILGIMSDTHGHLTEMREAASRMAEEFNADVINHLGDDSTDADDLKISFKNVVSVPGIFETRYKDPAFPNRIIKEFEGVPFLITHTPVKDAHDLEEDINPTEAAQDGDVKIVLYGHTHKPFIGERYGAYYINPGHIHPKDNRGSSMTFAILELKPHKLEVKIIELKGSVIDQKTFFIE